VTFFDTNVLVYSIVTQDEIKKGIADRLIEDSIKDSELTLSPLVLSELIFVLSKLKIDERLIKDAITLYKPFIKHPIEPAFVFEAYELCRELGTGLNINDAIHLKFAERFCAKIVTFDADFKKFKDSTNLRIELLGKQ